MSRSERRVSVFNMTKETLLASKAEVADSVLSRLVGLLGRRALEPGSGMWILPGNAVHSIGMLFTFDVVLIDKSFKVVGLRDLVHPFSVTLPNFRAESILELPAHTISRSGTEVGDQLKLERSEPGQDFRQDRVECTSEHTS